MSLQKPLQLSVHRDRYFKDQLKTTVDMKANQVALQNHIPRTPRQPTNRIANWLSEKPKTSGLTYMSFDHGPELLQHETQL